MNADTVVQLMVQPRLPLTQEERNDLRKRVLMGYVLSVEEARSVIESTRTGAAAAAMTPKEKKGKTKKEALSDDALNSSLDSLLGL